MLTLTSQTLLVLTESTVNQSILIVLKLELFSFLLWQVFALSLWRYFREALNVWDFLSMICRLLHKWSCFQRDDARIPLWSVHCCVTRLTTWNKIKIQTYCRLWQMIVLFILLHKCTYWFIEGHKQPNNQQVVDEY
jgi:hypothetical protein